MQAVRHPLPFPVKELSLKQRDIILYGPPKKGEKVRIEYTNSEGQDRFYETGFSGVIPNLQRRYQETSSEYIRSKLEEFMSVRPCPACGGKRLKPEALAVTVAGSSIYEVTHMPVDETLLLGPVAARHAPSGMTSDATAAATAPAR